MTVEQDIQQPVTETDIPGMQLPENCLVMLVDDQVIVAEALRRILEPEADIDLHYCSEPGEAVKMAEFIKPTVILLDLVMPDIDGKTLLRYMRANHRTNNIPIVVLSSKEDPALKAEAFAMGANDYLIKWPDSVELLARIRYHSLSYLHVLERDEAFRALRVSQRKLSESNLKLQELASRDGLTGLANRRYLDEFFEIEWRRALRDKHWISVLMIDIDFFKSYNDNYGHQAGDECLKKVALVMKQALKRPSDLLGRYGGEEFVVILPETSPEGALQVAERMVECVCELQLEHVYSDAAKCITVSTGVATTVPSRDSEPDQLIALADRALYDAKEGGRNQVVSAPIMQV